MRTQRLALLVGLAALAGRSGPLLAAADPSQYTLYDLGVGEAVGIDDAGQVAVNAVFGQPARASVRTLGASNSVVSTPVPGIVGGSGDVTLHAIGPTGTVVGYSNVSVAVIDTSDENLGICPGTGTFEGVDRACLGGHGATTNLGRVVVDTSKCPQTVEGRQVSEAWGVNASGVAVGYSSTTIGATFGVDFEATMFAGGTATGLDVPGSRAYAVNSAGEAVGWLRTGNGPQRMTLWSGGTGHDIDVASTSGTTPLAISDQHVVVGERNPLGSFYVHGFVTKLSGTSVVSDTDLVPLGTGHFSGAHGIDAAGLVVGYTESDTPGLKHAVVWIDAVGHDLNDLVDVESPGLPTDGSTVVLKSAEGIDGSGEIACTGDVVGTGGTSTHVFLLRPSGAAGVKVAPSPVEFGDVIVGDAKQTNFTISNGAASAVKVNVVKPAAPFSYAGPTKFTLGAGASKVVKATFSPKPTSPNGGTGFASGQLDVVSADATVHVALQGNAVLPPPAVSVSPPALDFDHVPDSVKKSVTLTNLESVAMKVTLSGLTKPFSIVGPRVLSLAANGTAVVDVDCAFDGGGIYAPQTLVVTPALPLRSPTSVPVTGSGALVVKILSFTSDRNVEVQPFQDGWKQAEVGMLLRVGDRIHTGFKAGATLLYPHGAVVQVKPMALLVVTAITDAGGVVNLLLGEVDAQVEHSRGSAADFNVKTPTSTASVRGTVFSVVYDAVAAVTDVSVQEGTVQVAPLSGDAASVTAGNDVESTATSVSAPAPSGTATTPVGGIGRSAARAKVLKLISRAEKRCGLAPRDTDIGMVPIARGWSVTVVTTLGTSMWTVLGKKVKPVDAAAVALASRCKAK